MQSKIFLATLCTALLAGTCAFAQDTSGDDSNATAQKKWPLAAKAGVDTHADKIAPPGAVNQGAFNMNTWKRGHTFDPPPGRIADLEPGQGQDDGWRQDHQRHRTKRLHPPDLLRGGQSRRRRLYLDRVAA